ncbi:oxalate decarboxylase OxdC [Mycolicibacterium mageritense DSM 44476 = CIP 104973]|uniref:Cupin n=1 Tax=Mycolicibacterium mageritense TaxID=53462 RepID=A0AAI8XQ95_MYCME|nr:cupin domain-containing protein [Mycolicibacterium mageritense]OKH79611.1 cupin [Mycobacterium sp. SWH-M3]MCC9182998.1 cupin domain-containing protein [Mycolicibacterium mageritense]TXI64622.1 MAG: cupin domain-containing protein [Mycolicibacterium mageritense]CDO19602.1 oxalate decarboxylase OxdC [Mycolicibacterium mageritense DSM 44476 = CIP 104973]BBX35893.1 cupin [Mycolicibacterium mageritense]
MTVSLTRSSHTTSLLDGEIVEENDFGSIRRVTADNFPILRRMSIKRLVINPGAMRTPHWHANANELTYCVSGVALVSMLDTGNRFSTFTVSAGEMFHADSGSLHHIENIGTEPAEFIVTFSSERPEDFGLGASFGAMTDAVLGNTYDLDASDFAVLRRDTVDRKLAGRAGDAVVPDTAGYPDPHKFAVEAMTPPVTSAVGSARTARVQFWPALKDLSMYSLRVREDGMREPHWHPVTAEMGYVHSGSARMTVMDPDGTLDTWHMRQGDVYFIPRAYPHHIEVVDAPDLHFLIFFDQPTPADIGYRNSASAYSRAVLAATFDTHIDDLPEFPFTPADPLIVGRRNPVDR